MSQRSKFIFDLSQKILLEIISGAVSNERITDPNEAADLSVKLATALFDKLSDNDHVGL